MKQLPIEVYVAQRYLRANIKQSLIVMLAVGIGVAIIIFIPSVNLSFFNQLLRKTVSNAPHITITRELETLERNQQALESRLLAKGFWFSPQTFQPQLLLTDQTLTRKREIKAYNRLAQQIETLPGVIAVAPGISKQAIISRGSQSYGITLNGIVPEQETRITNLLEDVKTGNLQALSQDQIFLGWRLADELGVKLGGRVQILTADRPPKSFKVAGLIKTDIYSKDLSIAYIALQSAQQLFGMSKEANRLGIKVRNIYAAEDISQQIHQLYGVKSRSWMEESKIILDQIKSFRVIIGVISFLIVFSAASSITSILIMVVASKSKEIGILKAMGATRGNIVRLFLLQGVFLSILGSVAGIGLGWLLIQIYNATPFSRMETVMGIGREPVTMNIEYAGIAIFYAILSCILASIIPAWRAGSLDPVKAINQ